MGLKQQFICVICSTRYSTQSYLTRSSLDLTIAKAQWKKINNEVKNEDIRKQQNCSTCAVKLHQMCCNYTAHVLQ